MNAKEFFEIYTKNIYTKKDDEIKNYYYQKDSLSKKEKGETPWTQFVNREIVPAIIRESIKNSIGQDKYNNKAFAYNEFFKIDVTGWSYYYKEENVKGLAEQYKELNLNFYAWKMEIAFEHENDYKDWAYEVVKLLPINCPLRVVVGYNHCDNRNDDEKITCIVNLINAMNEQDKLSKGEFLIIIGNWGGGEKAYDTIKDMIDYKGYKLFVKDNKVDYEPIID